MYLSKLVITQNMYRLHNGSTYIVTQVSKLLRWLSDLINLSRRLAIWRLGRTKLNCSQQNSIICILLVLKSFIRKQFATKSRELERWMTNNSLKAVHRWQCKRAEMCYGSAAAAATRHRCVTTWRIITQFVASATHLGWHWVRHKTTK